MTRISDLPIELLDQIVSQLEKEDWYNLCLTSKKLNASAFPFLSVDKPTLVRCNGKNRDFLELEPLRQLFTLPSDHPYRKSRRLHFQPTSPGPKAYYNPCPHWSGLTAEEQEQVRASCQSKKHQGKCSNKSHVLDYPFRSIDIQLGPLVKRMFKPGQIKDFSWDTGTCVPRCLLGQKGGLLPRHHARSLERLSITTGSCCPYKTKKALSFISGPALYLGAFRNLTHLTWIGTVTFADLYQLRNVLLANEGHMQHLHLDFIDPRGDEENNTVGEITFLLEPAAWQNCRRQRSLFPDLRTLRLAHIDIQNLQVHRRFFPWSKLTHLSLIGCVGAHELMDGIFNDLWDAYRAHESDYVTSPGTYSENNTHPHLLPNLKTLEFVSDLTGVETHRQEWTPLKQLLQACHGGEGSLENLYVHLAADFDLWTHPLAVRDPTTVWTSLGEHQAKSLRRLSYELVRWSWIATGEAEDGLGQQEEIQEDPGTMGLRERDLDFASTAEFNFLTRLERLEALGLRANLDVLGVVLKPLVCLERLRLLHIRDPGNERDVRGCVGWLMAGQEGGEVETWEKETVEWCRELCKLLDWVFGEEGLAAVHVVAYGDFSCRGEFLGGTLVVRRGTKTGWVLHGGESSESCDYSGGQKFGDRGKHADVTGAQLARSLLREHKEMLESAPTYYLRDIKDL